MTPGIGLSGVIQLVDGFSRRPAEGVPASFRLGSEQTPCHPFAKPQAFYAFTGLAVGDHPIEITAEGFYPACVTLRVPMRAALADSIVVCRLEPDPLYPYPAGTPLIRGRVTAAGKTGSSPLAGVTVAARYHTARGIAKTVTATTCGGGAANGDCRHSGAHDGHYVLALAGRLNTPTAVVLSFTRSGYACPDRNIALDPARILVVDAEMT